MTREQYEDFRLMLKGCGAGLPMYSTLNRFERVWFSSIIEILTEKDKQIKELEQKLEQTEKDLADYQFNYPTIKELEKENKHLKEEMEIMTNFCGACKKKHEEENNKLLDVINNQDVKIADLEQDLKHKKIAIQTRNKRIADLEETCKDKDRQLDNWYKEWQKQDKQIEQAKQIISKQKKIIEDVCDINFLSSESKKTLEQAEQFISEVEK